MLTKVRYLRFSKLFVVGVCTKSDAQTNVLQEHHFVIISDENE